MRVCDEIREEILADEGLMALEEARAGKPMVYRLCVDCNDGPCDVEPETATACGFDAAKHKPEGIAVELIDGCIRILDYFGKINAEIHDSDNTESTIEGLYSESNVEKVPDKLPVLVAFLHQYTASALLKYDDLIYADTFGLLGALAAALSWVKKQGLDPLAILLEKHEYNKTRPYKHGKQF